MRRNLHYPAMLIVSACAKAAPPSTALDRSATEPVYITEPEACGSADSYHDLVGPAIILAKTERALAGDLDVQASLISGGINIDFAIHPEDYDLERMQVEMKRFEENIDARVAGLRANADRNEARARQWEAAGEAPVRSEQRPALREECVSFFVTAHGIAEDLVRFYALMLEPLEQLVREAKSRHEAQPSSDQ